MMHSPTKLCLFALPILLVACGLAAADVVPVGAGGYTNVLPPGAKAPQANVYRTENVKTPLPTNQWWISLAWLQYSERAYPHPLAVVAESKGFRIWYPGPRIQVNGGRYGAVMPKPSGDDLVIGHSAQDSFPDSRVDSVSDWFVTARFGSSGQSMKVSYGHGSPFVYALFDGGYPRVTFGKAPKVWSGDEKKAVLGVTVNGVHYGLFGPTGSTWKGLDGNTFTNEAPGKAYFSVALLPDGSEKTLELFKKYAYAHVTDTKVGWKYDPKSSDVTTTYTFTTKPYEGSQEGTLFSLYPHQWRYAEKAKTLGEYSSVRGTLKLAEGKGFVTVRKFPGVLPSLPVTEGIDKQRLIGYLKDEASGGKTHGFGNTYDDGKWMARYAQLAPLADQCQQPEIAKDLRDKARLHLEGWLSATSDGGKTAKARGVFYYDKNWGTLIGYPASYFSDTSLNDHHFHYGYFIKAAAEVARHDPSWAKDDKWGGMIKMLIRDIANADRKDKMFPFLRCYDPYAGHSWASGDAKFADGNNQESSSEAMNAWSGLILWGEATGDTAIRDLGIYLYTTEMTAIHEYWFDVHGTNFPKGFNKPALGIVWGASGNYGTWFSGAPEMIQGINFLPIHGGSLYLGYYPKYVEKNYNALGGEPKHWQDIFWMFRALADAPAAVKQFEAGKGIGFFDGNGRANTYAWIYALNDLGQVDTSVTADDPLYAVFRKGKTRSYCAYNVSATPRTVTFSDGFLLQVPGKAFATAKGKE